MVAQVKIEKITSLKTAFKPMHDGEATVTAATSSSLNDGGAALLIMAEAKAAELGMNVKCRIRSYADAEQA